VATIVVREREGRHELWVDGSLEASTIPTDVLHLGLLGHLPCALLASRGVESPAVTVIGLGAGFTSQAVASWGPRDLSVHEIERSVVRAAAFFVEAGGGLPAVARTSIGDGRRGLLADPAPRDLVTSDPVHPAVAGSAWLYSADHYAAVVDRLSEDGLLCQWLPLYEMVPDDLRLAVRTFASVLPHPYLFLAGGDGLLIGARRPLSLSEERLRGVLEGGAGEGLAPLGLRSPGRLLGLLAMGPDACRRFAGDGPLNTDDRLLLELRCGRNRLRADAAANERLLGRERTDPRSLLSGAPSERFESETVEADAFHAAMRAVSREAWERAAAFFEARASSDPADRFAARMALHARTGAAFDRLRSGDRDAAVESARKLLATDALEPPLRLDLAELLAEAGEEDESRAVARDVLRLGRWPRALRLAGERPAPPD
jgi:spermidine synthase